jgi:cyclase
MSLIRVIPTLLLKGKGLVKTVNFKNPNYLGDPINAVRIFNDKEVDELVLLDIEASKEKREPNYNWIKDIVSESFMPIGYGGGITSIEQIKKIFDLGVEKVILNTRSFDFDLISKAASIYGEQSIVVCIDAKKALFGGYNVYGRSGQDKYKISPDDFAKKVVNAGAGEIIIQSIDNEGSMGGYDMVLTKLVSSSVNVPIIASGGAGTVQHLKEVIAKGGASAVTAGSLFVYKGKHNAILINYPSLDVIKEIITQ